MTTRLSQRKVKAGSPAYSSLMEEIQARATGSGTDYIIPTGGIPRTDMSNDVQLAIAKAESSYIFPEGGISAADLALSVQDDLILAASAYQKPATGIPSTDLEISVQDRLNNFASFYVFPTTGIPYVDMDTDVQGYLEKALSAYQKPAEGIPVVDLSLDVQNILNDSGTKYVKPVGGIPLIDLEAEVVRKEEFNTYVQANNVIHDHNLLDNVGSLTHLEIDDVLDEHSGVLVEMTDEIEYARGDYSTIGRRMDAAFFEQHDFVIKDLDFLQGTKTNLVLSEDNILHFAYTPESFPLEFYDMSTTTGYEQSNKMTTTMYDTLDIKWPSEMLTMNDIKYANNVGVVLEGFIYAPITGLYNFGVQASGDYTLVVNKSSGTFSASDLTGWDDNLISRPVSVNLTGGQFYRFSLIGTNKRVTNSVIRIVWKRPNVSAFEPVSKQYFSKTGYNSPTTAVYETQVIDTEKLDIRQFKWDVLTDHDTPFSYLSLEWNQSADGITFGSWTPYVFGDEITGSIERFFQARITFTRGATNLSPVVKEIRIDYLSNKNNLYHEWQDARQGYTSLRSHMDALNARINGVEDLATSIDHSIIDTTWLQNVRFEHIDINLMRMHWEQLKALKTSAHIMPSGFVEDFHDLNLMDENFHKMEVRDSKLYPVPHFEVFDTDPDWMQWDRLNMSPESGSLKLTFVANEGLTGPATRQAINNELFNTGDMLSASKSNSGPDVYTPMWYQPFYVNEDDFKITSLSTYSYSQGSYGSAGRTEFFLYQVDSSGNFVNGVSLGYQMYPDGWSWKTINANVDIPIGKRKWAIGIKGSAHYYDHVMISRAYSSIPPVDFAAENNPENKNLYMIDQNKNEVVNKYLPLKVTTHKGYHSEGEAQFVKDIGVSTNFIEPEIDVTLNGGTVEVKYSSSNDGEIFSTESSNLSDIPDGRYLKVWTRIARTNANQTPMINRLSIRHNPNNVVFQTKPVRVSRIPTHTIIDVVDSDNTNLSYKVSRDGGQTFKPIIPGVQTDVRDIGAGQEMVVRIFSDQFEQDDKVWIDYMGLQTITHEDFNDKSVIVSHHQVEKAIAGQREFNVTKAYMIGDESLQVYVNGVYQIAGISYVETNNRTITMNKPLLEGDYIVFRVAAAAYEFANSDTLEATLLTTNQKIDTMMPVLDSLEPRVSTLEGKQILQDTRIEEVNTTTNDRVSAVVIDINTRINSVETAANTRVEEVNMLTNTRIDGVITNTTNEFATVDADIAVINSDIDILNTTVISIDDQINLIDTVIQGLSSTDTTLSNQLTLLQQTVDSIKIDLEEVKALMAVGSTDWDLLVGRVDTLEANVASIQTGVTTIVSRLDAMDILNTSQNTLINTIELDLGTTETTLLSEISTVRTGLEGNISTLDTALRGEIATVNQSVVTLDQSTTTNLTGLDTRIDSLEYIHPTDADRVSRDKMALNLDSLDADVGTNGIQLLSDVVFPLVGEWESVISWQSDKPQYVSGTGTVNQPTYTDGDQAVILTATISNNGLSDTKLFTVNVPKLPSTEEERATEDTNALSITHLDQDAGVEGVQVLTDVTLETTGSIHSSSITWSSSDTIHFSNLGVVTQPEFTEGDAIITLTATVTNGSIVKTKMFTLTVPALPDTTGGV